MASCWSPQFQWFLAGLFVVVAGQLQPDADDVDDETFVYVAVVVTAEVLEQVLQQQLQFQPLEKHAVAAMTTLLLLLEEVVHFHPNSDLSGAVLASYYYDVVDSGSLPKPSWWHWKAKSMPKPAGPHGRLGS